MDRRPTSIFSTKTTDNVTQLNTLDSSATNELVTTKTATAMAVATTVSEDQIIKLGNGSGNTIAAISGKILEMHKGSSQGVMGDKLNDLIKNARGMSTENFKPGTVRSLMNKVLNVKYDIMTRFDSAKDRVDHLVTELQKERDQQLQVFHNIENLIQGNADYCVGLLHEIDEGQQMLEVIADEIATYGDNLDSNQARGLVDARSRYDLLEKKLVDLESFKAMSILMDPKLTAMKSSAHSLINTFDMIVGKMVPAYMMYFADYLNALDQERAEKLSNSAIETFDEIIKASGDLNLKNMGNIGRLKNRQLINVETIKQEHEKMITGLNNLRAIEEQARLDRAQNIVALRDIEQKAIEAFSKK